MQGVSAGHRVRPEEVVEEILFFAWLVDALDIVDVFNFGQPGGDAAVQSEILSVNDRSKWQCLERIKAGTVGLLVIADNHLLPEVEVFSALATFMVTTQQEDLVRELDFEAE